LYILARFIFFAWIAEYAFFAARRAAFRAAVARSRYCTQHVGRAIV